MRLHHTSNECGIRLTLIYAQVHCNLHYELLRKIYNIFYGEKEELWLPPDVVNYGKEEGNKRASRMKKARDMSSH